MRTISIRQFQRNFYKELHDLPFIVTRQVWEGEEGSKKKIDIQEFVVTAYASEAETNQAAVINVPEEPTIIERFKNTLKRNKPCGICEQLRTEGKEKELEDHRAFWHPNEQ